MDRPRVEPQKLGIVPDWTHGPTRGALKTWSCSELDSWIVHTWEVLNSWIVPTWSLKEMVYLKNNIASKCPKCQLNSRDEFLQEFHALFMHKKGNLSDKFSP